MKVFNAILVVAFGVAIVALIALLMHQEDRYSRLVSENHAQQVAVRESCRQANEGRAQLNVWGDSVRQFMFAAELARRAAGTRTDLVAAAKYANLAGKVQPLPYRDCNGDGESDIPR